MLPKDWLLHELKPTHSSPLVKGVAPRLQESAKDVISTIKERTPLLVEQRRKPSGEPASLAEAEL